MHNIRDVVGTGMCVGCGACSVATGGKIPVEIGRRGSYEASLEGQLERTIDQGDKVCPFSDTTPSETEVAARNYPDLPADEVLGRYKSIYAGRLTDESKLQGSSSGGLTSWVLSELMTDGHVDGVIHVGRTQGEEGALFEYRISETPSELADHRKSTYYSTSFDDALLEIRGNQRRYAIAGVPCFLTAARHVAERDEVLAQQLQFFVGLVCGHLKSAWFAESMAWQVGVSPQKLQAVDFRIKEAGEPANNYRFGALESGKTEMVTGRTNEMVGGNWGHGMFQMGACNYCDDIFAESADVVLGDAWLPRYSGNSSGTNIVVTRNALFDEMLQGGSERAEIDAETVSVEEAVQSQAGNVRHRRAGLRVRLHDDHMRKRSVPTKRVTASLEGIDPARIRIARVRRAMTEASFKAYERAKDKNDLRVFLRRMTVWKFWYLLNDRKALKNRMLNFVEKLGRGRR